jgi:hypothetical protein
MLRTLAPFLAASVAFAAVFAVVALWLKPRAPAPPMPYALNEAISDIKRELQLFENAPGEPLGLRLSEAEVSLKLTRNDSRTVEAGLAVPVFSTVEAARSVARSVEHASTVKVVLAPPQQSVVLSTPDERRIAFASLLLAVREALREGMANEPRLDVKTIELTIAFVLVSTTEDSAGVTAEVLSISGEGKTAETEANTIKLTYVNPAYVAQQDGASAVVPP